MSAISLFMDPAEAIMQAKMARNSGMSFFLLLLAGIIAAMAGGISTGILTFNVFAALINVGIHFAIVFIGGLFLAFSLMLVMKGLGGTGGFFEGLTTVSYALFIPSIAYFLVMLILSLSTLAWNLDVLTIATIICIPIALLGSMMGAVTFVRGLKELFSVDIITAFVGLCIVGIGAGTVYYMINAVVVAAVAAVRAAWGLY